MHKKYLAFSIILILSIVSACGTGPSDGQPGQPSSQISEPEKGISVPETASSRSPEPEPEPTPKPVVETPSLPINQADVEGIMPVRLEIPAIQIDANVIPVPILPNGQMGVPKQFDQVGILSPWTLPGEQGSAAISGHFDHYTGPAIFYGLKKLKPGDLIILSDSLEKKLTFTVQSVEVFKTSEAPLDRIFNTADKSYLNLITCAGKFNKKTQEHAMRLVVFTQLINP
ncbi:class F sortase [Paenibacillus sp. J2TS4]|uniref:class F sortase n=1 Tax=Paenibacillus sp. J2TS4 TaxID=2807194 RepID=UPI001AFE4218|nr:class F sortase [Paenibacillus sp. J2TS4]GIP35067.1 hypothetical protein J2TS4_42770 [Paenibacillus sp. J2TS4]